MSARRDDAPPALSAAELSRRAVGRLLRGGTWQALAREGAWEAVRASGVEPGCLDWLTSLVEMRLAECVDGLAAAVPVGAPEEAAEILSRAYLEVVEWAVGVLDDRAAMRSARVGRPRLAPLRRLRPRSDVEVPPLVAEDLQRSAAVEDAAA
jgi:hypothetical protein